MATDFSRTLSLLRQEKGVSQRKAAAELGISQALLSHYENGIREPGLPFVVKACDYYRVSADYLLGRTLSRDGAMIDAEDLYDSSAEKGSLKGSILATLQKKLVVNSANLFFDVLGKTGNREAITAAGDYLCGALYRMMRALYRRAGENIAWGQRTPEAVMKAWMNSSGHRANILNEKFTSIGVGCYEQNGVLYWTQLFIY